MSDEIWAAHWVSNHLPRLHAGQVVLDPWTGEPVLIDDSLVLLVTAMWSAGIRTVASCQNVAEFAQDSHLRAPAALDRAIAHGHGYVRLVVGTPTAHTFLRSAVGLLQSSALGAGLVQIEFQPSDVATLEGLLVDARRALQPTGPRCGSA